MLRVSHSPYAPSLLWIPKRPSAWSSPTLLPLAVTLMKSCVSLTLCNLVTSTASLLLVTGRRAMMLLFTQACPPKKLKSSSPRVSRSCVLISALLPLLSKKAYPFSIAHIFSHTLLSYINTPIYSIAWMTNNTWFYQRYFLDACVCACVTIKERLGL